MPDNKISDNIVMVVLRYLKKDIKLEYCQNLKDVKNIIFANRLPNNYISIFLLLLDRKSTRLNSSHLRTSRMPSSA